MLNKKIIVLSGANITSGGPLTIFNDALRQLSQNDAHEIIAVVGNKTIFYNSDNISFIELPNYKKFILLKFYYEYFYFKNISRKIIPDIWISLNDFTPNVLAKNVFTYFHNASIFFKIEWSDFLFSRRIIFQKMYYTLFLKFNIHKNKKFIVQQNWIGKGISGKYNLPLNQILVFKPNGVINENLENLKIRSVGENQNDNFILFYPTRAYGYKNIEIICDALDFLLNKYSIKNIELRLTVDEDENGYTKFLKRKYHQLPIVWLGAISRDQVENNYREASVLVFPSRLETWGLPLSEFAKYQKPIFAIDLGYVYETLHGYPYLAFFKPYDVNGLAKLLKDSIDKLDLEYYKFSEYENNDIEGVKSWNELLEFKLKSCVSN